MRLALRLGLFSLLFALTLPLISCDSGGSDNSEPDWIGTWEVLDFGDGGGAPSDPNYWNLSQNELQIVESFDLENDPSECELATFEVVEQDGRILTFQGVTPNAKDELIELQFESSGETLSATILSASDEPENVGNEITLGSISEIPLDTDRCETTD